MLGVQQTSQSPRIETVQIDVQPPSKDNTDGPRCAKDLERRQAESIAFILEENVLHTELLCERWQTCQRSRTIGRKEIFVEGMGTYCQNAGLRTLIFECGRIGVKFMRHVLIATRKFGNVGQLKVVNFTESSSYSLQCMCVRLFDDTWPYDSPNVSARITISIKI